jgi:hypothetical protein
MTQDNERSLPGQGLYALGNVLHGDPLAVLDGADLHFTMLTDVENGVGDPIGTHRGQSVNIDIVSMQFHLISAVHTGELATLSIS